MTRPNFRRAQAAVVAATTLAMSSPAFAATIKLGGDNGELGFYVRDPTRRDATRRRARAAMATSDSDDRDDASDAYDDARDAFERAGADDPFVPHHDQRDDVGASDGDASEDSRGSDDESDGEDLMNDMERCGSDASDARRARARTGTGRGFEYLNFELSLARGRRESGEDARRAARGARRDGGDGVSVGSRD